MGKPSTDLPDSVAAAMQRLPGGPDPVAGIRRTWGATDPWNWARAVFQDPSLRLRLSAFKKAGTKRSVSSTLLCLQVLTMGYSKTSCSTLSSSQRQKRRAWSFIPRPRPRPPAPASQQPAGIRSGAGGLVSTMAVVCSVLLVWLRCSSAVRLQVAAVQQDWPPVALHLLFLP